jgi:protein disulfide-isomerase
MKSPTRICCSLLVAATLLSWLGTTQPTLADEGSWKTNFTEAKTDAASQKKAVLLNFTGSDWCPWCVRMDKEVFSQKQFSDFASKNLVLVKLDFPRSKQLPAAETSQNQQLAKQYQIEGFPTYVLLDSSGKELKRQVGYLPGGASEFLKWAGHASSAPQ